jgi:hypothetical protein
VIKETIADMRRSISPAFDAIFCCGYVKPLNFAAMLDARCGLSTPRGLVQWWRISAPREGAHCGGLSDQTGGICVERDLANESAGAIIFYGVNSFAGVLANSTYPVHYFSSDSRPYYLFWRLLSFDFCGRNTACVC